MRRRVPSHSPDRLTHEQFLDTTSSLSSLHQTLQKPFAIHWHEFYELAFILAGEGTHHVNGVSYPLTRGSIFFLTPADFHSISVPADGTLELFNVIFSDRLMEKELRQLLFQEMEPLIARCQGEQVALLEAAFRQLWEEAQVWKVGRHLLLQSVLQQILITLLRLSSQSPSSEKQDAISAQHPAIHQALTYLHYHFRESLTLEGVAASVQLTPNYFSECFHKETGIPFQSYLQERRLRFAASLLSISSLPVTEISAAAGFNTLAHFDRAFKHKFGYSPSTYRRQHAVFKAKSAQEP